MGKKVLKIITTGIVVAITISASLVAPDIIFRILDNKNIKSSQTVLETDDIEMTQKESTIIDKMKAIGDVKTSTDMEMDDSEKKLATTMIGKAVDNIINNCIDFTDLSSKQIEKKLGAKKQNIKKMLYISTENDISSFAVYDYKIKYDSGISAHAIFDEGTGKVISAIIEGINMREIYGYIEMYNIYDKILSLYYDDCKVISYEDNDVYDIYDKTSNYAASGIYDYKYLYDAGNQDINCEYKYNIIYKNETLEYIVRESSDTIEFNYVK